MSDEAVLEADRLEGAPHPREHGIFVGHAEAEAAVLQSWQANRLPHAFLIGGPEGIGKATLAYRIARFVLAHPVPDGKPRKDLSIAGDHPVSRQVAALSHPDLLVLRRVLHEDGSKLFTEIRVDDVRRIVSFFGSTRRIRRLSRLHRRFRRGDEPGRHQRAPEAAGGAAARSRFF